MFKTLIKLHDIYENEVGKVRYDYVHVSLPHYLSDMFAFTHDIHNHDTRHTSRTCVFYISYSDIF